MIFDTAFGGGTLFNVPVYGLNLGIAIDSEDAAYAVGVATAYVPTTAGALLSSNPSRSSAVSYLVKFDPAGKVVYGTYLNGTRAQAVAVDGSGNAYVRRGARTARRAQKTHCAVGPRPQH